MSVDRRHLVRYRSRSVGPKPATSHLHASLKVEACRVNDHSEHLATSQSLAQVGIDDSGRTQAYGALPEER